VSVDLSLADILRDNAMRFGERPAYLSDGRVRTHGELYERALALAAALEAIGLRRQDRIAVYARNSIEFGEVLAAGQLSGLIVATVNFRLGGAEVARIVADAAPRVLFVDADLLPIAAEALAHTPSIEVVVGLDGAASENVVAYEQFLASGAGSALSLRARPE
jgi:acyl-CoA synthetase (AMP-forming)/AMP-acid ligase II